jgi:hypothetical protein
VFIGLPGAIGYNQVVRYISSAKVLKKVDGVQLSFSNVSTVIIGIYRYAQSWDDVTTLHLSFVRVCLELTGALSWNQGVNNTLIATA